MMNTNQVDFERIQFLNCDKDDYSDFEELPVLENRPREAENCQERPAKQNVLESILRYKNKKNIIY